MQVQTQPDPDSFPRAEGLCTHCVDRHCCPMATIKDHDYHGGQFDEPVLEGQAVLWCPMYG